jgi:hypothetical protein
MKSTFESHGPPWEQRQRPRKFKLAWHPGRTSPSDKGVLAPIQNTGFHPSQWSRNGAIRVLCGTVGSSLFPIGVCCFRNRYRVSLGAARAKAGRGSVCPHCNTAEVIFIPLHRRHIRTHLQSKILVVLGGRLHLRGRASLGSARPSRHPVMRRS